MGNYCTLKEVKSELGNVGHDKEAIILAMINQANDFIDDLVSRTFEIEDKAKYYDGAKTLYVDDLVSVTTIKLDLNGDGEYEITMSSSDYILYPLNKTPKTRIEINESGGSYCDFALGIKKGVEITGTWGYGAAVPAAIKRAAIIQVCRWYKRKDTAYSTAAGAPEVGQLIVYKGLDPDIELIIKGKRRMVFA